MNLEQSNKFLKEWKALKAKGSTNWNEKKKSKYIDKYNSTNAKCKTTYEYWSWMN